MSTVPRMTERSHRLVELVLTSRPGVAKFQVGAANTLDTAFVGTTPMFTFPADGTFRSPSVRKRRLGHTQYNNRGLARAHYDPEDYWTAGSTLPHDAHIGFVRVAEVAPDGTVGAEGPIYIVTPAHFFTTPRPLLTIQGTAPDVAASGIGIPPQGAMHFYTPRFFDYCGITNKEPVGGNSLFISFGEGLPEIEIPPATTRDIYDAADNEVFVRGGGGPVAFDAVFAVVNGEMA